MSEEQYVNLSVCGDEVTMMREEEGELITEEIIMESKTEAVAVYSYTGEDYSMPITMEFELTFDNSEEDSERLFWDNE
jgi:uncharacterized linocin/CFP29 family protein